jgi:hypothetical protein
MPTKAKKKFNPSHVKYDGIDWSLAGVASLSREQFTKKCKRYPKFKGDPQRDKNIQKHWDFLQEHLNPAEEETKQNKQKTGGK